MQSNYQSINLKTLTQLNVSIYYELDRPNNLNGTIKAGQGTTRKHRPMLKYINITMNCTGIIEGLHLCQDLVSRMRGHIRDTQMYTTALIAWSIYY